MTPYIIFGAIIIWGIVAGLLLSFLYYKFLIEISSMLTDNSSNKRGCARYYHQQKINFIICIKRIYYSSHLFNVWRIIMRTIKYGIRKPTIYRNSNEEKYCGGNKNHKGDNKRYSQRLPLCLNQDIINNKNDASQPKQNDTS